ncbi:uncharacterized protein METZ01_LOCUS118633, partial [marine metagenome]
MSRIPVALQMYTVRDVCEKDFVGALRQVADIGYEGVELAGSYGLDAEVLRDILVDVNLKCVGSHTGFDDIDQVVTFHRAINCNYVGSSSMSPAGFPTGSESLLAAAKYSNDLG